MNARRYLSLLVAFALGATAAGAAEPAPPAAKAPRPATPPLSPRFIQVRERIDALFQHRNAAPGVPDPRTNPFRAAGSAPVATPAVATTAAAREPAADPPPADLALLQQAVAVLKVNGTFEVGDQFHLVLNARLYKNGDVIQVQVQGQPVYLRVREITRHSVTLAFNETEITLKF
jgi:hypothetical protein